MQCPKCQSENTQRLSILYQAGTQQISTTSTTFGGGAGSGYGIGSATTSTSGTAQSFLAKLAAPPAKKSYGKIALLLVIGVAIAVFSEAVLLFAVPASIAAYIAYKAFRYNKDVYPGLLQKWRQSWHCNKCGTIYAE